MLDPNKYKCYKKKIFIYVKHVRIESLLAAEHGGGTRKQGVINIIFYYVSSLV